MMLPTNLYRRVHLLNFTRTLTVTSLLFLLPLYFVRLGFSGWQIGAIISLLSLTPLLSAFPTGWINDRFSIDGVVRAGFLAVALVLLTLAFAVNFYAVAAAFFVLGTATNVLDVSLNSLIYKDETAMDQNRKYGQYVFWLGFGPVLGIAGGGLLTQVVDFRALLLVFGAVMLAAVFAVRRLDAGKFHLVSLRDYGRDFRRPKTLRFAVFVFFLGLHWAVEGTVYGPFLERRFGLNTLQTSLYMAAGIAFLPLAALLVGRRKFDLRANRRLLLGAMVLSGAGLILMTTGNVVQSLLFRFIHDFGDGALGVLIALTTSRLFEKRSIGGSAGLLLAIMILAKMAGAMIFSPLGFRYGLHFPFLIAGALLLADAAYGALIFKRVEY